MAKVTVEDFLESLEGWTALDLSRAVKGMEEKFGITAAALGPAVAVGTAQGAQAPEAQAAAEEKTSFDVILAEVGPNKIQVIKELRAVTNLGLKEAKDLVDTAPKPVKSGATKEEAKAIKEKLEAAGAKVELK